MPLLLRLTAPSSIEAGNRQPWRLTGVRPLSGGTFYSKDNIRTTPNPALLSYLSWTIGPARRSCRLGSEAEVPIAIELIRFVPRPFLPRHARSGSKVRRTRVAPLGLCRLPRGRWMLHANSG
jgi:hypothetical protein